jgi:hypothetical protein
VTYTVSWPVTSGPRQYLQSEPAATADAAEGKAHAASIIYGSAAVSDDRGVIATYVDGRRWATAGGVAA